MLTEVLIQTLLIVAIIAGVLFITVFWRLYEILGDMQSIGKTISRRVTEIDASLAKAQSSIEDFFDALKNFLSSFEFIKMIKNKISKTDSSD